MDEKDPMEIERERRRVEPDGIAAADAISSLEDPDVVEEEELLDNNVDDEREAGLR